VGSPASAYDEPGTRTRQAWLRTSLTALGVALLAERGLVLAGAPRWVMALGLLPAIVVLGVAVIRVTQLREGHSDPARTLVVVAVIAAVMGTAAIGLIATTL
jgi:hypothetical protein